VETLEKTYGTTIVYEYPSTLLRVTSEDLRKMLDEAEELFRRGDFIQSCEKFYKLAEEIVKILAEVYAPETMKEVSKRLREKRSPWDTKLLYDAVEEITCGSNVFSEEEAKIFRDGWRSAMALHRDCFHDFLLSPSMRRDAIEDVKKMVETSEKLLKRIEEAIMSSATVNTFQTQEFN